jgi:hypothetical protein
MGKVEPIRENIDITPMGLNTVSGIELNNMDLPPLKWIVDGLIPEGVTILAGAPKLGKSYLALQLCVDVCEGNNFLRDYECDKGEATFLTWEDNPRRVRERLQGMTSNPLPGFHFQYKPKVDTKNLDWLEAELDRYPKVKLVVFDTLGQMRIEEGRVKNPYSGDVGFLQPFCEVSYRKRVGILFVTHTNQDEKKEDELSRVQGTNGLIGTADTIFVLKSSRNDKGVLSSSGRDTPNTRIELLRNNVTHGWIPSGPEEPSNVSEKILAYFKHHDKGRPSEIANEIGEKACDKQLSRLVERKTLKNKNGVYSLA